MPLQPGFLACGGEAILSEWSLLARECRCQHQSPSARGKPVEQHPKRGALQGEGSQSFVTPAPPGLIPTPRAGLEEPGGSRRAMGRSVPHPSARRLPPAQPSPSESGNQTHSSHGGKAARDSRPQRRTCRPQRRPRARLRVLPEDQPEVELVRGAAVCRSHRFGRGCEARPSPRPGRAGLPLGWAGLPAAPLRVAS